MLAMSSPVSTGVALAPLSIPDAVQLLQGPAVAIQEVSLVSPKQGVRLWLSYSVPYVTHTHAYGAIVL